LAEDSLMPTFVLALTLYEEEVDASYDAPALHPYGSTELI